jgi:hypothetical protein
MDKPIGRSEGYYEGDTRVYITAAITRSKIKGEKNA